MKTMITVATILLATTMVLAGGDTCDYERVCSVICKDWGWHGPHPECAPCEPQVIRERVEVPVEKRVEVPVETIITREVEVPVEVERPQPRNALGGGLAAFWLPDYFGDHEVEYGPALSYERIWSKWVLHVGASAAEVPVSTTALDYCSDYNSGGGWYYPCLATATKDEWMYSANLMLKRRF